MSRLQNLQRRRENSQNSHPLVPIVFIHIDDDGVRLVEEMVRPRPFRRVGQISETNEIDERLVEEIQTERLSALHRRLSNRGSPQPKRSAYISQR